MRDEGFDIKSPHRIFLHFMMPTSARHFLSPRFYPPVIHPSPYPYQTLSSSYPITLALSLRTVQKTDLAVEMLFASDPPKKCALGAGGGWGRLLRVHAIFKVKFGLPFKRENFRVRSFDFNSLLLAEQGSASPQVSPA